MPIKSDGIGVDDGYAYFFDGKDSVRIHRLVAVAEYGFDSVAGLDVHHKNGDTFDNTPGNLELMEHGEHSTLHAEVLSKDECGTIRDMYDSGETIEQLSDSYGVSTTAIHEHLSAKCQHGGDSVAVGYRGPRNGPWRNRRLFTELYVEEGKTYRELSELWDCSMATVGRWAKKHGLN